MKVWLLTTGCGEDGDEWFVISIHKSEEGAKAKLVKLGWQESSRCNTEEWEIED